MAIDTIITKISKDEKATVVSVLFTDNATIKKTEDFRLESFNLEAFKAQIRSKRDSFIQADDASKVLAEGPFDPTPTPPVLTTEQQEKNKFLADLSLQRQMEKGIAIGLKKNSDQDYLDQVILVKSEFLPEYVTLL